MVGPGGTLSASRPVLSLGSFDLCAAVRASTPYRRQWHVVGHQVRVQGNGVLYRGERYRSLSEIARLITGTRWSGPRFFGHKP